MNRSFRVAAFFLLGTLLGQVAWILAVPPYRGSDEFDHVYRAASVAAGHWRPDWQAPDDGRGDLIPVPRQLVIDGAEICRSYDYVGPDNCRAVGDAGNDLVTVASAAARYNPVFYWVIGWPAQLAEGAESVYLMRAGSALVSALLIAASAFTFSLWSSSRWPLIAMLVALTPVLLYSTIVAAPNGVEMAGGMCVWAGLLGLATPRGRGHALILLLVAGSGAVVLTGVRTLGPLWLTLAVLTSLVAVGSGRSARVTKPYLKPLAGLVAAVLACTIAAATWSLTSKTNSLEPQNIPADASPWGPAFGQVPLWFFQSIAAFPMRKDSAPTIVYALETAIFLGLLGLAIKVATNRLRGALTLAACLSLAVPFAITIATILTAGTVWQGRYTLPFSLGVALVAGLSLEMGAARARLSHAAALVLSVTGALALVVSHVVSVVNVLLRETQQSPLSGDPRWIQAPAWMIGLIMAMAVLVYVAAIVRHGQDPSTLMAEQPLHTVGRGADSGRGLP